MDPLLTQAKSGNNTVTVNGSSFKHLVLDCSALSYIDLAGTKLLTSLNSDLKKAEVSLSLAGCSDHVIEQLRHCQFFDLYPNDNVYPSVVDAVLSIRNIDDHDSESSNINTAE